MDSWLVDRKPFKWLSVRSAMAALFPTALNELVMVQAITERTASLFGGSTDVVRHSEERWRRNREREAESDKNR